MEIKNLRLEMVKAFKEIENGQDRTEVKKEINESILKAKLKRENENRVWRERMEKERIQKEKENKAFMRKYKAEQKKLKDKVIAFKKVMLAKGNRGFADPSFITNQPFAVVHSQLTYINLFNLEGDLILRASELQFGKDGLVYAFDEINGIHRLFQFDSISNKLEGLFISYSLKELKFKINEIDPDEMLGFNFKMYDHEKEEYRISKLTPEELLAEKKEKLRIEEEKKKLVKTSFDDLFEDLFKD
jgi:hypothetical protein